MAETVPVTTSLEDIYTTDALPLETERWNHLLKAFEITYGHLPEFVARSPGRVNIIGEHIDYSLYSVLPMAITADCLLAVSTQSEDSTSSEKLKLRLSNIQSSKFPSQDFELLHSDIEIDSKVHEWTNYFKCGLKGGIESLKKKHGVNFRSKSMNVLVDGTVPSGGGLSSSAAFVSASALAVIFANGEKFIDKTELTELAIVSERAVGVNSGGMDQSASVFSLRGSAVYVSFVPNLTSRPVKFPKTEPEMSFLIAQSFIAADKHVTSPVCYNLRVVECSLAAAYLNVVLNKALPSLKSDSSPLKISLRSFHDAYYNTSTKGIRDQLKELCELAKSVLTKEEGYSRDEIAEVLKISQSELENRYESKFPVRAGRFKLRQRVLHVFSEALRVQEFLELLENPESFTSNNRGLSTEAYNVRLGDIMNKTQDSCRDLYECSCPELDQLCTIARNAGAYGSRLTGAGWGGCTVHLVPVDKIDAVINAWEREYYGNMNLTPEQKAKAIVLSRPGTGSAIFIVKNAKLP